MRCFIDINMVDIQYTRKVLDQIQLLYKTFIFHLLTWRLRKIRENIPVIVIINASSEVRSVWSICELLFRSSLYLCSRHLISVFVMTGNDFSFEWPCMELISEISLGICLPLLYRLMMIAHLLASSHLDVLVPSGLILKHQMLLIIKGEEMLWNDCSRHLSILKLTWCSYQLD